MNLSVSNIAWKSHETREAISILKRYNIDNIDIVPTLIDKEIDNINTNTNTILKQYSNAGINFTGMQSLLFSCPSVSLFDGTNEREILIKHLIKIFKLASKLKIKNLVFGSPKNRFIKTQNNINVIDDAINFFNQISNLAALYNCNICLEANPKEYGCNFITNTFDAIEFVKNINHKNLRVSLDTSTIILNNENLENIFKKGIDLIEHIHISSPFLKGITLLENTNMSSIIRDSGYKKWVVLECNFQKNGDLIELEKNIETFKRHYN